MKRAICIAIAFSIAISATVYGYEAVMVGNIEDTSFEQEMKTVDPIPTDSISLECKSAVLIEPLSGTVLYSCNPDLKLPPASITKIMTLILTMEALEQNKFALDDMVTPSAHACSMGGSQIWLKPDEQMSVNDLLKATAIASANDAAVALGELVSGSEQAFVQLMNQKAKELGMTNTHFENATGLDAQGHVSTAADIAKMSACLLSDYPSIKDYSTVWMDSLRGGATSLVNTNKLVRFYSGCIGLKTGTTSGAGYCLSAAAERDNMTLIAVVMGSETGEKRFAAARTLLDTGFAAYEMTDAPLPEFTPDKLPIQFGESSHVPLSYSESKKLLTPKGEGGKMSSTVLLKENVSAPVQKGEILGYVTVNAGDDIVGRFPVMAAQTVNRLSFWKAFEILAYFTIKFA